MTQDELIFNDFCLRNRYLIDQYEQLKAAAGKHSTPCEQPFCARCNAFVSADACVQRAGDPIVCFTCAAKTLLTGNLPNYADLMRVRELLRRVNRSQIISVHQGDRWWGSFLGGSPLAWWVLSTTGYTVGSSVIPYAHLRWHIRDSPELFLELITRLIDWKLHSPTRMPWECP